MVRAAPRMDTRARSLTTLIMGEVYAASDQAGMFIGLVWLSPRGAGIMGRTSRAPA